MLIVVVGASFMLRGYFYTFGALEYYVSANGNDANPGTIEEPFKTLTKAVSVLKGVRPSAGATVYLREGVHEVSQTINLAEPDSGTTGGSIVYQSYPGEKAVITGTKQLPQPAAVPGEPGIYSVDLSQLGGHSFKNTGVTNLLRNGERQQLARYPNLEEPNFNQTDPWEGQFLFAAEDTPAAKDRLKYQEIGIDPDTWGNVSSGVRAVVFSGFNWWDTTVSISEVDKAEQLLQFGNNTTYDVMPGNHFYLENSKAFLDQDGEWFYDKEADRMYVYLSTPPSEADLFSVVVSGDIFSLNGTSNIEFRNLAINGSAGALINIRNSPIQMDNIHIVGNHLSIAEREAIKSEGLVTNLKIVGNVIEDTGWEGVSVQQDESFFKTLSSGDIVITDNKVTRVGNKWRKSAGIDVFGVGINVSHNEIFNTPRMGIHYRGNNNLISQNKIYNTNLETTDSGGIYTIGRSWLYRGNVVENNYIYNTGGYGRLAGNWTYPNYTFGVYLDDFANGDTIQKNIIVDSAQAGVLIHGGRDNKLINNFIINPVRIDSLAMIGIGASSPNIEPMWQKLSEMESKGYDKQLYLQQYPDISDIKEGMTNEELYAKNEVTNNIFYSVAGAEQYAVDSRHFLQGDSNISDKNIFWSTKTYNFRDSYEFKDLTFQQWQDLGFDTNSLNIDPMFINVADANFSFGATSPTGDLGIVPINISSAGPRTSGNETNVPQSSSNSVAPPTTPVPTPEPTPTPTPSSEPVTPITGDEDQPVSSDGSTPSAPTPDANSVTGDAATGTEEKGLMSSRSMVILKGATQHPATPSVAVLVLAALLTLGVIRLRFH